MSGTGDRPCRRVRAVLVNWNAPELTARSVEALRSGVTASSLADIALEVVIVDNASSDDSVARLRAEFPDATVIANTRNVGFAAACNQAMLGHGADHVLLVNNDAVVAPDALAHLVGALEADPRAGAAVPALLLEWDFVTVRGLPPGERIDSISVDGVDLTGRCVVHGALIEPAAVPPHRGVATTTSSTTIEVPLVPGAAVPLAVEVEVVTRRATTTTRHHLRPIAQEPHRLVNSLGTDRTAWGEGFDRAFGRRWDPGRTGGASVPVRGFSGGAVLLRNTMLESIGGFAPEFFAYAEDTDLSWRAQRHGWTTVLAPDALVDHRHGATAGPSLPGFHFLNHRNWLLTVLRNGRTVDLWRAVEAAARRTVRAVRTDLRSGGPVRGGWGLTRSWIRVWWAVAAGAPGALAVRAGVRRPDRGHAPSEVAVRRLLDPPTRRPVDGRP